MLSFVAILLFLANVDWIPFDKWKIALLTSTLSFIYTLKLNPKWRYLRVFYFLLYSFLLLNKFYFRYHGYIENSDLLFGSSKLENNVNIAILLLAFACLILDFFENSKVISKSIKQRNFMFGLFNMDKSTNTIVNFKINDDILEKVLKSTFENNLSKEINFDELKKYVEGYLSHKISEINELQKRSEQKEISKADKLFLEGKFDDALNYLEDEDLDELDKHNSRLRLTKSYLLIVKGNIVKAKENFEHAIRINPSVENQNLYIQFLFNFNFQKLCLEQIEKILPVLNKSISDLPPFDFIALTSKIKIQRIKAVILSDNYQFEESEKIFIDNLN